MLVCKGNLFYLPFLLFACTLIAKVRGTQPSTQNGNSKCGEASRFLRARRDPGAGAAVNSSSAARGVHLYTTRRRLERVPGR